MIFSINFFFHSASCAKTKIIDEMVFNMKDKLLLLSSLKKSIDINRCIKIPDLKKKKSLIY